jgi:hypothetical protein
MGPALMFLAASLQVAVVFAAGAAGAARERRSRGDFPRYPDGSAGACVGLALCALAFAAVAGAHW